MSADETPEACHPMPPSTDLSSKINNCVNLMERKLCLAFKQDFLSLKENKNLQRVLQIHESYCESLERNIFNEPQEYTISESNNINTAVKKTFKNVCSVFAQNMKDGLSEDFTEVQLKFLNSLKTIVSMYFFNSQKEETVPQELDEKLNTTKDQDELSTNLTEIDALIDQCKREIQTIHLKMAEERKKICFKKAELDLEEAKIREASLQQELEQLTIQLNHMYLEDRDKERQIQEETEKVINVIEYMLQFFDDEMDVEQADLEAREEEFRRDTEELKKMKTLFEPLEVEYNEVLERRWQEEERKKEETRILQLRTRAATKIQAWWKGYRVRKAIKEQSKKKAKKGKGKKSKAK
ncbi:hypothetical protein WMY93_009803 [Mugilogobius chulae]|uniref:Dynein regulatory complex protein 10 n=1 Tax=Mugilogobius chulae TaxID=88201 RepID=A0AAW0PCL4_9GOBI